jgi:hypothetical protein
VRICDLSTWPIAAATYQSLPDCSYFAPAEKKFAAKKIISFFNPWLKVSLYAFFIQL